MSDHASKQLTKKRRNNFRAKKEVIRREIEMNHLCHA